MSFHVILICTFSAKNSRTWQNIWQTENNWEKTFLLGLRFVYCHPYILYNSISRNNPNGNRMLWTKMRNGNEYKTIRNLVNICVWCLIYSNSIYIGINHIYLSFIRYSKYSVMQLHWEKEVSQFNNTYSSNWIESKEALGIVKRWISFQFSFSDVVFNAFFLSPFIAYLTVLFYVCSFHFWVFLIIWSYTINEMSMRNLNDSYEMDWMTMTTKATTKPRKISLFIFFLSPNE